VTPTHAEVNRQLLSAHRSEKFGQDYGALLKEWRMLQRVAVVIDGQGSVAHTEYVPNQMAEPDYDAAVGAVKALIEA
jgi:thioredoxin-dependent peroxiredoxin